MPISVVCGCGKRFDVPDSYRGRTGACTACGQPLVVPAEEMLASTEQLASFAGAGAPPPGAAVPSGAAPITLAAPAPPAAPAGVRVSVGKRIGPYEVLRKLGGPASTVLLARGPKGEVALKVLPAEIVVKSPTAGKRFLREARSLFGVEHEALPRILDAGEDGGTYYLALEHCPGQTLEQWLAARGGRIGEPEAIAIAADIAGALVALRGRDLVHRNIKPEHVLVDERGRARLVGLGLVRGAEGDAAEPAVTVKGGVVGTPQYMPPEQARAGDLDVRSDLYSLGMTLYVALSGQVPFQDKVVARVLKKLMTERPPALKESNPALGDAICAVVMKLLEKRPEDRYQSPQDLLTDLAAIREGRLVGGLPPVAAVAAGSGSARSTASLKSPPAEAAGAPDPRATIRQLIAVVVVLTVVIVLLVLVLAFG